MSLVRSATRRVRPSAVPCARLYLRTFSASAGRLSATRTPEEHDLVIVGGGPAGLVLASALAASRPIRQNAKITLLEGSNLDKVESWSAQAGEFSNRVSSITAENVALLKKIGVWSEMDHSRTRPIEEMQVWDGISGARIQFHSPLTQFDILQPFTLNPPVDPMATLVENLNLQRGALRQLRTHPGAVELVDRSRVASIEEGEGGWPVVNLESPTGEATRSLRARLLIGADGFNSPVKAYSKIETFGRAYDTHGIVASLQLAPGASYEATHTAWQRFLPEGPIAFLPLGDASASLVWSTTPKLAGLIKTLPSSVLSPLINAAFALPYSALSEFLASLQSNPSASPADLERHLAELLALNAYEPVVGQGPSASPFPPEVAAVQPGSAQTFPLRLSHTSSYLGMPAKGRDARTALVGDAAHTVHPLAGQGLNMGLGDVAELVRTLERTVSEGGDVGSYTALRSYPRARYVKNHALLSACDHLHSLFGTTAAPVVWARSTGLEVVNELDSVKELLMGGAGSTTVTGGHGGGPGIWGAVGKGVEGVMHARDIAGMVGGALWGQVKGRLDALRR